MANYADQNFRSYPSYDTLADDTFCSRRTVIRHIKEMSEMGLLEKQGRMTGHGSMTNIFTIKIVSWLQSHGYVLTVSENGFLTAKMAEIEPQVNNGEGCSRITSGVQQDHQWGAVDAPDPVIDPVIDPITFKPPEGAGEIPYEKIVEKYNEICGNRFAKCTKISEEREKEIAKLWRAVGKDFDKLTAYLEDFERQAGSFYDGTLENGFRAGFTYISRPKTVDKTRDRELNTFRIAS